MTCKDCIHQIACFDWCRGFGQEAELCEHFSYKTEWLNLPCKAGERVFSIVYIGNEYTVVADRISRVTLTESALLFDTNWFYDAYFDKDIFLTQEAAEKALEKRRRNK